MSPIKTAICSFGMSGEVFHAPLVIANAGFELITILQRSSESALAAYPNIKIAKDFKEILEDESIELVIVNTPNTIHFPMAKAALEAGKHVVIEKPITPSSAEAAILIALAKEKNLILSVFHNKRLENDYLTLKSILDQKLVGNPVELHWHYDRFRTHITHKKWKENKLPGAGTLYDLGSHLIDAALRLFGTPEAVTANLRILRAGGESTDCFTIRLDFPTLAVYLASSTMVREPGPQLMLHGTLGSYVKYGSDPQEAQLKAGLRPGMEGWGIEDAALAGILHTEMEGKIVRKQIVSERSCYEDYYDNIFKAIRHQSPLFVPPEQALQTIQIIEMAEKSHAEKRSVLRYEYWVQGTGYRD